MGNKNLALSAIHELKRVDTDPREVNGKTAIAALPPVTKKRLAKYEWVLISP
jgi:hypothetical protein